MKFDEILTLIDRVSQSSLTSFSLVENQDGIQISMKKEKQRHSEKKEVKTETWQASDDSVHSETEHTDEQEKICTGEQKVEEKAEEIEEKVFVSPMDGTFFYSEGGRLLLRVGKELNDEDGVEIGSIQNEEKTPYNLSVRCLGEVTQICVEDGQKVRKGEALFWAKVEKGDTEIDWL